MVEVWTGGSEDETDLHYERFHVTVGELASQALESLSVDLNQLEHDGKGWTSRDTEALKCTSEVVWLGGLMVPSDRVTLDSRNRVNKAMALLKEGLPFSSAERRWLFEDAWRWSGPGHSLQVRTREAEVVSEGLVQLLSGDELLDRWSSWRRELGSYASGEGLEQTRGALETLVDVFAPETEMPEGCDSTQ